MTAKVLVVDDEPDLEDLVRQRFRRQIKEGSIVFGFARDGVEALAVLAAEGDFEVKDAQLIFSAVWDDLLERHGQENLRFPREFIWLGGAPGAKIAVQWRRDYGGVKKKPAAKKSPKSAD